MFYILQKIQYVIAAFEITALQYLPARMGSVKPRLTRSFSSPLVDGLGCDLALTGVSVGLGPVSPASASGHKLEASRSLQASDTVTSSGDRGGMAILYDSPELSISVPETSCYLLDNACNGCLSSDSDASKTADKESVCQKSPGFPAPSSAQSSSSSCHYIVRWPSECQVLPYRIRHIKSLPPTPEVFYDSTGQSVTKTNL